MSSSVRSVRPRAVTAAAAALLAGVVVATAAAIGAAPANDRAFHGYDSVATNGFGASESWAGNLRLFTGHDHSGEAIIGYCIQRGLDYPRGTDPEFADANSGFAQIGDVPAQRGVPEADRQALAYLLWRYGPTTDDRTAAAMFLLTHLLAADPDFGSTTLDATVLGPDWPEPEAVRARAAEILGEARARRGPWTLDVTVTPDPPAAAGRATATATLAGPGGPIGGVEVALTFAGSVDDAVVLQTGDDGRVSRAVDVPGVEVSDSGDVDRVDDASEDPGVDVTTHEVEVTATVAATPGGYRVFHGRPGTQQVITDAGDGPPLTEMAAASITVVPPPPPPPTTVPDTTTTAPSATVPETTVPETTVPTSEAPTTTAPTTTAPTTTIAPPPSTVVTVPRVVVPTLVPIRPAPAAPVVEERLAHTGGAPVRLATAGVLALAVGVTMVGVGRRLDATTLAHRRPGAHLRR